MAFEPRFAVVLVGSSGEGGAKLHRRNFGEAVENLTGSGEYHWMAGNFLKYGAVGGGLRQQERRRPAGRRARADRAVRAAPDLHQLRRARRRATRSGSTSRAATWRRWRRARCSGCSARRTSARRDDYKTEKMPRGERRACSTASWPGASTTAGTPMGRTGSTSSRGRTGSWGTRGQPGPGPPTDPRPRSDPNSLVAHAQLRGEGEGRRHRRLLRRRLDHPALGRDATTPSCSPTGRRTSSAGTRPTSAGAPTAPRTSCGGSSTASWTASTRR